VVNDLPGGHGGGKNLEKRFFMVSLFEILKPTLFIVHMLKEKVDQNVHNFHSYFVKYCIMLMLKGFLGVPTFKGG